MNIPSPPEERPLLPWLIEALKPMTRSRVKEWLRDGHIQVNGAVQTRHDAPVRQADRIKMVRADVAVKPKNLDFDILYQDEDLIAVDKPIGLLSVASDTEKKTDRVRQTQRVFGLRGPGPAPYRPPNRPRHLRRPAVRAERGGLPRGPKRIGPTW